MNNYRATKITLYKNGDPWFGSMDYRFMLGKDLNNLDGLFHNVSTKMDFINGIAYMFDTEGTRITSIDQVENEVEDPLDDAENLFQVVDGGEYVCSQDRRFIPGNYGRTGNAFLVDGGASARSNRRFRRSRNVMGKKTNSAPTSDKPNSADGRVIKIVNAEDHSVTERVLLNLKTTQPFEDVVGDLGQVLKIRGANKLYAKTGKEVRSFSHLRMDFFNVDTFIVSAGPTRVSYNSDGNDADSDGSSRSPSPANRGRSLHKG